MRERWFFLQFLQAGTSPGSHAGSVMLTKQLFQEEIIKCVTCTVEYTVNTGRAHVLACLQYTLEINSPSLRSAREATEMPISNKIIHNRNLWESPSEFVLSEAEQAWLFNTRLGGLFVCERQTVNHDQTEHYGTEQCFSSSQISTLALDWNRLLDCTLQDVLQTT